MPTRALGGALALIIAVAAAAPASAAPRWDPTARDAGIHSSAKKKRKKVVSCKKGQMRVKLGGRLTCRSVSAALPAPQEADQRLVLLQDALAMNLGGGRDNLGRPAPSAAQLFRRLGPGALAATKRVLPRAVALAGNPAALAAAHGRVAASAGCRDLKGVNNDTLKSTEKSGGYQLDFTATVDALTVAVTGPAQNGQSKRVEISFDWCKLLESTDVPNCPTSQGVVDAKGSVKVTIGIAFLQEGKVVEAFTETIEDTTQMHGQVGDDGKLGYVDIHDSQSLKQSSPGSGVLVGASSVSSSFIRTTRVNMRGQPEQYVPDETKIEASASLGGIAGLLVGGSFRENALRRLKQASDKIFADVVKRAIEKYRERENGWNQPPYPCAKLEFDPASDTKKLRKGDRGQFTARNIATRDGGSASGRWTLTGSSNATITPGSAEGSDPSFNYDVQKAGKDIFVTASFRVVSKAGVAEGTWKQPTEGDNINTITGTFTGHDDNNGQIVDWTGTATFKRQDDGKGIAGAFQLESGTATLTASGSVRFVDCQQTGTMQLAVSPQSVWGVEGEESPFKYQIVAPFGYPGKMETTWTNCADSNLNGTAGDQSLPSAIQSGQGYTFSNQTSPDGFTYEGSYSAPGSDDGETVHWTWSMKGAP